MLKKIRNWFKEHKDGCLGWTIIVAIICGLCAIIEGVEIIAAKLITAVMDKYDLEGIC